jgi:Tol biopolymer transport system component
VAVDPVGAVRWTITAPAAVHDPRWAPSGFRIAYRSDGDLWVVAGDGTDERRVAENVAPVAPAWRPIGDGKLAAAPGIPGANVLTYVASGGGIVTVDVDTGERIRTAPTDVQLLTTAGDGRRAVSPDGARLATIKRVHGRDELTVQRPGSDVVRVLFAARGRLTGPTWSPDGRWLLVGWPAADQWLFIPVEGEHQRHRVVAFDRITEQFAPGDQTAPADFPQVAGWVLPER